MTIHLRHLDALRGLLATYVLLGHCRWLLWAGQAEWIDRSHPVWSNVLAYASASLRYGREAVFVFFVLSGFFIHLKAAGSFAEGIKPGVAAGPFFKRRLHRLLAPYLLALALTVACDGVGRAWFPELYQAATGNALLDQDFSNKGYTAGSVLPALVLVPSSLGLDFGSNGPLWSIAYEVVYYALYPAWLALRTRSGLLAFGVVPVACLVAALIPLGGFPANALIRYPIWLAGAGLAECLAKSAPRAERRWLAALIFVAALVLHHFLPNDACTVLTGAAFGTAAVWFFVALPGAFSGSILGRGLEYLGNRSYTTYMTHFPVLTLLAAAVVHRNGSRPLTGWWALAGALLATSVGLVCFHICERHFLHPRLRMRTVGTG